MHSFILTPANHPSAAQNIPIGLGNFYHRFIPKATQILHPLNSLLSQRGYSTHMGQRSGHCIPASETIPGQGYFTRSPKTRCSDQHHDRFLQHVNSSVHLMCCMGGDWTLRVCSVCKRLSCVRHSPKFYGGQEYQGLIPTRL